MIQMRLGHHNTFDTTDVESDQYRCDWLERQCRTLIEQRQRAFRLGYQSAVEGVDVFDER